VSNLGKLAERGLEGVAQTTKGSTPTLADRWISSRLSTTIAETTRLIETYQYGEAGRQAYDFLWGDFADWYIEIAKIQLAGDGASGWRTARLLVDVLDQTLRLLHPYIPFVTEEIWQRLKAASLAEGLEADFGPPSGWPAALIITPWPEPGPVDQAALSEFGRIQEIVRAIRNARAEYNVAPGRRIAALISAGELLPLLQRELPVIAALAALDPAHTQVAESLDIPARSVSLVAGGVTIALPLADLVDLDAEIARLRKELANAEKQVTGTAARLDNPGFVANAPANVVEGARNLLAEWQDRKAQIEERLRVLEG
jgi:valyl-tRNA synthetase